MAKVKEIQICGGVLSDRLFNACGEYIKAVKEGTDRAKIHFDILLDNGEIKSITFRQEEDGIQVYGDFKGMPIMIEYAKRVQGATHDSKS